MNRVILLAGLSVLSLGIFCTSRDQLNRELVAAVKQGNIEKAGSLIDKGADAYAVDEQADASGKGKTGTGMTPLTIAADQGDAGMIRLLLERKVNVNSKDGRGSTALITASRKGYVEIVGLLLSRGANVEVRDGAGFTAYMTAVLERRENVAGLLKEKGASMTDDDQKKIESSAKMRESTDRFIDRGKEKLKELFKDALK